MTSAERYAKDMDRTLEHLVELYREIEMAKAKGVSYDIESGGLLYRVSVTPIWRE